MDNSTNSTSVIEQINNEDRDYLDELLRELDIAQGCVNKWVQHLSVKYELRQGDNIQRDGVIKRKSIESTD